MFVEEDAIRPAAVARIGRRASAKSPGRWGHPNPSFGPREYRKEVEQSLQRAWPRYCNSSVVAWLRLACKVRRMNQRPAALALSFSSVGHFFAHLLMLLFPTVILALEGRWGMSYGELLELSLGGFVLFGLGALPAGWLGDRWSAEGMMIVFFLGTGGAAIATGFSDGPWALALGLAGIGLFGSIYHPVGTAWLVRDTRNRGRALGINGIAGSIGLGAAAFVAGALTEAIGWRAAFMIPGALCTATGVALLFCVRRDRPVPARIAHPPEPEASRSDITRTFVVLSFTMLADGIIAQAIPVALPKAFAAGLAGLTDGGTLDAGGFVTLVFLVAATAQLAGGWLADRFALKAVYVGAWAVQVPLFVLAAHARNAPLLMAMMAINYLGVLSVPAENALLARYTPSQWRGTAFGAKFLLALGVSTIGVKLVAVIYDGTGDFAPLWLTLGGCAAFVAAAGMWLPGRLRRPRSILAAQPAE
jgi:MFS transporter, FSR family, fosmidomycin resistance protein